MSSKAFKFENKCNVTPRQHSPISLGLPGESAVIRIRNVSWNELGHDHLVDVASATRRRKRR